MRQGEDHRHQRGGADGCFKFKGEGRQQRVGNADIRADREAGDPKERQSQTGPRSGTGRFSGLDGSCIHGISLTRAFSLSRAQDA